MKFTKYFLYTKNKPGRVDIKYEWILAVIEKPVQTEIQEDGRIRMWGKITERDKYLRVVLLADGETIHNAFFDRRFKGDDVDEGKIL